MSESLPTIGHVLHRLYLAGAEVLAADLARRLQDRYRFVFFCLDEIGPLGQKLMGEGFKVVDLKRRPGVDFRVARRLGREVKRYGVDLLHAHQYTPFFYAALSRGMWNACRVGPARRPKLIFTEHGRHYPDRRSAKRIWANRLLLRGDDRVTAVGGFIRQALIENEAIPSERVEVIHNGIDPCKFRPDAEDREAARRSLGAEDHEKIVLQVARFHPVKDHATAVRAFARVAEAMPEARLVFVGDGDLLQTARAQVQASGLNGRVRFLGVRDDVERLLPGADVFLLSSLSEGISVTLLEAMASRLPIVATQVGGNPEVVDHGRNGLLAQRGDDLGLAHNLLMLLGDEHMRAKMGEAGYNRLLKMFTQEQMHAAYARLYGEMLG